MQIPFNEIYFNNAASFVTAYKKINELVKGDKFMAEIVDIKAETITLRLNDNSTIEAKSLVLPEAKIGERVVFAVKENSDSVIELEFVKDSQSEISDNFAKSILSKFEMPINRENCQIIKFLIDNNIELNKENVNKAMFFKYSDDSISSDKLLFLLEENIPADKNTISVLNDIISKNTSVKTAILSLCEHLVSIKDTPLGEKLFKLLDIDKDFFDIKGNIKNFGLNTEKKEEAISKKLFNEISDKLFIKIKLHNPEENLRKTPEKLRNIYEFALKGSQLSQGTDESLTKLFDNIKKDLEFASHISEFKDYIQIPFSFGETAKNQCELYVFKNPKGSKTDAERASMLLGLDTAFLGRIEIYINKSLKNLSIQIKSDKTESLSMLKKGFPRLESMLKSKGYSISTVSFKSIDEPFDVTMKTDEQKISDNNGNINKKRFSFDMRI